MEREPIPDHLDEEGQNLWRQCEWIIEGGAVAPSVPLQLQALALRRELRAESEIVRLTAQRDKLLAACERAQIFLRMGDLLGQESKAASLLDTLDKLRTAIHDTKGTA